MSACVDGLLDGGAVQASAGELPVLALPCAVHVARSCMRWYPINPKKVGAQNLPAQVLPGAQLPVDGDVLSGTL